MSVRKTYSSSDLQIAFTFGRVSDGEVTNSVQKMVLMGTVRPKMEN